jgi:hypothetical protein
MPATRPVGVPPLAGLCTPAEATRVGPSVDESVARLLRFHWVERRLAALLTARLAGTPEWEVKGAFALHQWLHLEHADALRRRIQEMRHPAPSLDRAPDPDLEAALAGAAAAPDTIELLAGVYGALLPALAGAYQDYLDGSNPLVDHPTRRVLATCLADLREALEWGRRALAGLEGAEPEALTRAGVSAGHVRAWLEAAGGIAGERPRTPDRPAPRAAGAPVDATTPRRDARFRGSHVFNFPPHVVYAAPHVPADERNLALLCKRLLEMDVPELMAGFLTERVDRPWEYYLEYGRQLWDEARHSMMGEVALEARGIDWTEIPLNVGFPLRLGRHASARERQVVLWAIEQSLMPGTTGKRAEWETAREAGDPLSTHFHDFDWADEVLHARIGRRWLQEEGIDPARAMELVEDPRIIAE